MPRPARVRNAIVALNEDPLVAGIIVQMPLPKRIPLTTVTETLDPAKDIDGIQPTTRATSSSATRVPAHHGPGRGRDPQAVGHPHRGTRAVVVGRSNVVGKPAALLLLRENATVTICHSHTPDLGSHLRDADIVVVAVGKPGLIKGQMLKRGAVVVDVGINVVGDGSSATSMRVGRRRRLRAHAGAGRRGARHERAAHDPPDPCRRGAGSLQIAGPESAPAGMVGFRL